MKFKPLMERLPKDDEARMYKLFIPGPLAFGINSLLGATGVLPVWILVPLTALTLPGSLLFFAAGHRVFFRSLREK